MVYAEGIIYGNPGGRFRKAYSNSRKNRCGIEVGFGLSLLTLTGAVFGVLCNEDFAAVRVSGRFGAAYLVLVLPMSGLFDSPYFLADRYSYLASLPSTVVMALALAACTQPWLKNCNARLYCNLVRLSS